MFIDKKIFLDGILCTLIAIGFFSNTFNIKIKIKRGAIVFTIIALFMLYEYSKFNLNIPNSDYSLYCRIINEDLFAQKPFWIYREFLFWRVLNLYFFIFLKNCTLSFMVYMGPVFFAFYFYSIKLSKIFFKSEDDFINFSSIAISLVIIPYMSIFENILRNGAAYTFLMAMFYFVMSGKYTKAFISCIIGIFIHSSIIIFIPIIFIYKFKNKLKFYSYFLTIFIYVIYALILSSSFKLLNKGLADETYAICIIYITLLIYWFCLPYLIKYSTNSINLIIKTENMISYTKILIISLLPFILFSFNPLLLLRIAFYYYVIMTPLFIGIINLEFKNKFQSNLIILLGLIPTFYRIIMS